MVLKGGIRRWPVAVFYNMLDLAAINSTCFKQCMNSMSRRDFIMSLTSRLCERHMRVKTAAKIQSKLKTAPGEEKLQSELMHSEQNP